MPIDPAHGQVVADSASTLKDTGNSALNAGDIARAIHMYTLGIDLALGGKASKEDALTPADWYTAEKESDGVLSSLLSNRSYAHLQQGASAAAAEDAEYCCIARPEWSKGHMRLVAALEAAGSPAAERASAIERGLRACPTCVSLKNARDALKDASEDTKSDQVQLDLSVVEQLEGTRRVAADENDPRRFMAAGDIGAALAVGAHGLEKDEVEAERCLRRGAEGGDVISQRNLGHLLLELGRPAEAATALQSAAAQGDEAAQDLLQVLAQEARQKTEKARFQLGVMASQGDKRAQEMLEEMGRADSSIGA